MVKAALAEENLDEKKFKPSAMLSAISNAKNELITPDLFNRDSYLNEIVGRL